MLIDRYLPYYDFSERHELVVHAPPERVYQALITADLAQSWVVRTLFALRRLPRLFRRGTAPSSSRMTLRDVTQNGFILLADDQPQELLLGLIGQFWKPDSSLYQTDAHGFLSFAHPNFAKAVVNVTMEPRKDGTTIVTTETRVRCFDDAIRRRFRLYWAVIRPFSGLIRSEMLRLVRRSAEMPIQAG